jgi:Tfp pilus assembly protein PilV
MNVNKPFARQRAGFTLAEVMITLCLTAMMCLAVFAGLQTISRLGLESAVRTEAYRLLQSEAERLTSVDYSSFVSSGNQTIPSSFKTSFLAGNQAQFAYPASGTTGRITFTRSVTDVTSTSTSKTLQVQVQWTWQGQSHVISLPVFRAQ